MAPGSPSEVHVRRIVMLASCSSLCFLAAPVSAALRTTGGTVQPITPARMTALSMFLGADQVVKLVMVILAVASVLTWGICISRLVEFRRTNRAITEDLARLESAHTLGTVPQLASEVGTAILTIAREEVGGAADLSNARSVDALTDRLSLRLSAVEGDAIQHMRTGFSILASIGATSPFIGLFGTVWGIMNSFIGISQAQTTNLAVVAPGIAEALLATAFGLVAAIPAVLIYNILSRRIAGFRRLLHNASARVACLVSRETERAQVACPKIAN